LKHRATPSFWKLYNNLPSDVQSVADKNYALLKANPKHPSLHFKNVKRDMWSIRVGIGYRAVAFPDEGGFAWVWIGTHESYDKLLK
jgi:hypothetical protein